MFRYYMQLAVHSLWRHRTMTGLMVLAIGLGIGASMTMLTVLRVMGADPMPGRSGHLYRPYLDPLPADYKGSGLGPDPSINLTWPDAMALLHADKAAQQAAMAGTSLLVTPARAGMRSREEQGRMTTHGFFDLFGLRFVQGAPWSANDDAQAAQVAVLSQSLARRLYGGADPVGRTVRLGEHDFRVVGVIQDWAPRPMFYVDAAAQRFRGADAFFVPLSAGMALDLDVDGNVSSWGSGSGSDPRHSGNESWLQFWVRLDTPAQADAYRRFLHNYAAEQKAAGRFGRPPSRAHLYSLMGWLAARDIVPGDVRLQTLLALAFFGVCLLNIVALLLAKYLRRSAEISVRRALGARRRDIFAQFCAESALIGATGGLLGLAVAGFGLWSVRQRPDDYAHLARMDLPMLLATLAAAIAASVLAGVLPAWRASHVAPALQLKSL